MQMRVAGPAWVAIVAVAALVAPAAAGAHLRTGVVAVDCRAGVSAPARLRGAVAVRIYESDLAIGLTARSGHTVIGLGYLNEPFFRIDATGVEVNGASPTAAAVGLLKRTPRRGRESPDWLLRSRGDSLVWHDARLRGLPSGVDRGRWAVPLVVDGRRVRLAGRVWRVHAPHPGPGWP